jgi:hypothetical protein
MSKINIRRKLFFLFREDKIHGLKIQIGTGRHTYVFLM